MKFNFLYKLLFFLLIFPPGCKNSKQNSLAQFQIYSSSSVKLDIKSDSDFTNLNSNRRNKQKKPLTITPVPRNYWWWEKRNKHLMKELKMSKNTKLLFIGDSITHYWEEEGLEIWKSVYDRYNPLNLGLGGDQTQHILYRLNQYDFTGLNPKVAVILAGTNNLALGHSPEDTARGIKGIVEQLKKIFPSTRIILLAIFPRGHKPNYLRKLVKSTNLILSTCFRNDNQVHFLDLGAYFMDKDKVISSDTMRDYLHLTSEGYKIWAKQMDPLLKKLLE